MSPEERNRAWREEVIARATAMETLSPYQRERAISESDNVVDVRAVIRARRRSA